MHPKPVFQRQSNKFMLTLWARQASERGTLMTWGEELHRTIKLRDATALRRMAQKARKEETRMFLNLLAGQRPKKTTQLLASAR
jgi:hypothetical protein